MIILDELKKLAFEDPEKYPFDFHRTNDQAILWTGALDVALYRELGYEIEEDNEPDTQYPSLFPLRGRIGWPTFAVWIFEEGEDLYVEFLKPHFVPRPRSAVNGIQFNDNGDRLL